MSKRFWAVRNKKKKYVLLNNTFYSKKVAEMCCPQTCEVIPVVITEDRPRVGRPPVEKVIAEKEAGMSELREILKQIVKGEYYQRNDYEEGLRTIRSHFEAMVGECSSWTDDVIEVVSKSELLSKIRGEKEAGK